MRPTLTVILDRSALHGDRFDVIAGSSLATLTKRGVVLVHHPMAFLEETIAMYEHEANRSELRKQLPFILEICNGRWFRARSEIWEIELTQNRGPLANVFEKERRRRRTEAEILSGVFQSTDWETFQQAIPEKRAERQKQTNIHRIQNQCM